jgi:hypothetical protein
MISFGMWGSTLNKCGTDVTKLAKEGKFDPVIGRQKQIDQVVQILSRRSKNSPCLIGDPSVRKTAIVGRPCSAHCLRRRSWNNQREKGMFVSNVYWILNFYPWAAMYIYTTCDSTSLAFIPVEATARLCYSINQLFYRQVWYLWKLRNSLFYFLLPWCSFFMVTMSSLTYNVSISSMD